MPHKNDELTRKLTEWLENQGYPLEMEVALAFQKANFTVSLSDFYDDFENGESREIDVTVLRWSDFNKPVELQVCCRIECKSVDKPWIIFVSQSQPDQLLPFTIICSDIYQEFLFKALKEADFQAVLKNISIFSPGHVGHGITQAFTTGQDIPYKAVMSSVKASIDRALKFDKFYEKAETNRGKHLCCLVFPAIVINSKLFECFVSDDSKIHLNEVQSGVLCWKGTNPKHISPLVHIVTRSEVNKFVDRVDEAANALINSTLSRMNELRKIALQRQNPFPQSNT